MSRAFYQPTPEKEATDPPRRSSHRVGEGSRRHARHRGASNFTLLPLFITPAFPNLTHNFYKENKKNPFDFKSSCVRNKGDKYFKLFNFKY